MLHTPTMRICGGRSLVRWLPYSGYWYLEIAHWLGGTIKNILHHRGQYLSFLKKKKKRKEKKMAISS
jgi:hypothetical protein